ncbi:MAG: hypothetical protein HQ568_08090, partial [Calditrichaeota bacterium]|nr:hypothetical protein [Calditrichota bacterium]
MNGYAYTASDRYGVRVIDIRDLENLDEVKYFPTPGRAYNVMASGNYLYVADGISGLKVINIAPEIVVDPESIDFGNAPGDESIERTVTIANTGGSLLTISNIVVNGVGFIVDFGGEFSIGIGDNGVEISVSFVPEASGEYNAD